jgi:lactate dehydrogenase-like 2-hydroxyacid dehydrogenase
MLINTARDARAAIEALKTRDHLWYLGIDVYEGEAPLFFKDLSSTIIKDDVFERLTTFPNTVITGHQGFLTREALRQIANVTLGPSKGWRLAASTYTSPTKRRHGDAGGQPANNLGNTVLPK